MAALPLYSPDDGGGDSATRGNGNSAAADKSANTAGVRYGAMNWVGEFRIPANTEVSCGAQVVIQSDRGIELGQQLQLTCGSCSQRVARSQIKTYVNNSGPDFYRLRAGRILREASRQDIDEHERLNIHVRADVDRCALLAAKLNLGMKIVTAEHLLGGERIVFYFRSEGRVDFRELVRELAHHYQTRIEMRQVGARDEARLVADYEVCGRECCCKNFLKKLRPVTMRMAKLQKSTLDPSKVSGRCGRLRCCLRYEHEGYDELVRKLPRMGARIDCELGAATVIDRQVLTQLVLVRGEDGRVLAIPVNEVTLLAKGAPSARKAPRAAPTEPSTAEAQKPAVVAEATPAGGTNEQSQRRRRSRRRRKPTSNGDRVTKAEPAGSGAAPGPKKTAPAGKPSPQSEAAKKPAARGTRRRQRRRSQRKQSDNTDKKNGN